MSGRHEPVLVAEVLHFLRNGPGLYLDATLGEGGHAEALLDAEPGARLLGCDRDPAALASAGERLRRFGDRVTVAHAAFSEIPARCAGLGERPFTGALFDLGLSSRQIDEPARGMSFMREGPLDLRMDPSRGEPAWRRLAAATEEDVASALREHGDLPQSRRLARGRHPLYRVDGTDLYLDLPVAPWEAALGATVQVPTPAGTVDLKIPAGSATDRKLRLKGRGLPAREPGDLFVVLRVTLPPADTERARALYRRMQEELHFDPRAGLGR